MLEGVRVVDFTHALAGPTCTQILADLGADVIKVEKPGGDEFRNRPVIGPSMFYAFNRNKKSIILDLKKKNGRKIARKLIAKSDVVVENLRPGVAKKLGLAYEDIRSLNSSLIYCSLSGFGKGPYEDFPTWDPIIQAMCGMMSVTGEKGQLPVRSGASPVDTAAGIFGALGIIAALYDREKTGKGTRVEATMLDAGMFFMSFWITYYSLFRKVPDPLGRSHFFAAPYGLYEVKDGFIFLGVTNDHFWKSMCTELGLEKLLHEPKFSTNELRVKERENIDRLLAGVLREYKKKEVLELLRGVGVPCGPLNTVKDIVEDTHVRQRGSIAKFNAKNEFLTTPTPLRFSSYEADYSIGPPAPGENTDQIMKTLSFTKNEIEKLKEEGVIF